MRVNSEISPHRNADRCGVHRASRRHGMARWAMVVTSVVAIAGIGGLWYWLSSLSRQRMFEVKIAVARQQLQLSQDEAALDTLSVTSDTDAPPEYRYLKALSLDRLQRYEPAHAEIRRAISAAPDDPKYKGLELKFRMFARERSAVDQLIELNRDFASTAAVALFAAYGFQAKAMLLQSDGNPKSAEYHQQRKHQTLETAVTMSADIPELHPELLAFTIRDAMPEKALRLLDGLLKLDPENVSLRSKKVSILVALKRIDDAAKLAELLYNETDRNLSGAEYFASVLAQTNDSKARDTLFEEIVKRFPRSTVVVSKYAIYLTRSGRLPAAQKQISEAIDRQTDPAEREALAFVSITLPLEVNAPSVAEEYLRKNRKHLRDELLVDFFEARILYLRKQFGDAIRKMLHIVAAAKNNEGGSRVFATEALTWVRRILADKVMTEQFEHVIKATEESAGPRVRVATDEQVKMLDLQAEPKTGPRNSKDKSGSPPKTATPGIAASPEKKSPAENQSQAD
ncbi:MAG: hypothetical protein O3B86_06895 [Planctomycetota bacterium]|nr:hypothetical protein [Planctomycetota bacterium]